MVRRLFTPLSGCFTLLLALAAQAGAWQSDQGDGTYRNPPLYADYPDPDIIRVGNRFYFATTTFANAPGLTLLESGDLVNWTVVSHVIPRLDGKPDYDLHRGGAYRKGIYAPSLRYRAGVYYIAVTPVDQHTRIYYSRDIRGPWRCHELDRAAFDPGLFFDTDGKGYIASSGGWDGHVTLYELSPDCSRVVGVRPLFYYKGAEGTKVVKRGGWYYVFNAIPRKLGLACSRARSLDGPFETIEPLDDRTGGHQGSIVDLPDGRWYGFIMRDCGAVGRMTFISPIFWRDNWPVWGTPEAPGRVPERASKPIQGFYAIQPATSDEFDTPSLGLQWQWNHNPDDARWSLTERPGFLRLKATEAGGFWSARNTLTQKGQGPWSRGEAKLDISRLRPGDRCGLGTLGKVNAHIAVCRGADGRNTLEMIVAVDAGVREVRATRIPVSGDTVYLRTEMDFARSCGICSYSFDGDHWESLGGAFPLAFDWRTGTFQGEQYALFCYTPRPDGGWVDIDWFRLTDHP